jgi:type IV secretory pathway VirB6-like protein
MNSSLWFCGEIIRIVSLITKAISLLSEDLFQTEISFSAFISNLNDILYQNSDSIDIFSFDGIVKSFSSFGMLNLIFTYSLRYILIQIFVIISPFAFLTLILESTEKFFFAWIKNFISLLLIQILLSIILLLAFSFVSLQEPTMQKLMYIASIYAINKANYFMRELIGGIYFNVNANTQLSNK